GNQDKAIDHYKKAIELGERQPQMIGRVVQLLFDRRRAPEAQELINQIKDAGAVSSDVDRLLSAVGVQTREYDQAVQFAQDAVKTDPRNFRNHLWLGQVLLSAGKNDDAEQSFREAVRLSDTSPEGWVALVSLLAGTNKREEAEK